MNAEALKTRFDALYNEFSEHPSYNKATVHKIMEQTNSIYVGHVVKHGLGMHCDS